MTCRELIDFLADYLDGTLPAGERSVFEQHLRVCPQCVDYLNAYRTTVRLEKLACSEKPDAPMPMPEGLKQAILAARKKG